MNKELENLMLEAGYAAPELAGRAKILADLIVKECIKKCDFVAHISAASYNNDEISKKTEDTAKLCGQMIKRHFDVK